MTLYNFTHVLAANSTLDYIDATTNLTPFFPAGIALAVFAVLFLSLKSTDTASMLMVAGFFTTSLTGLLWLAGYMPFFILIICMLITVVGMLVSYLTGGT